MSRISKRNAKLIRRGIYEARETILANRAGHPVFIHSISDPLERRAHLRTLKHEMVRIAKHSLELADDLRHFSKKMQAAGEAEALREETGQ